jgi:hypothetical protein
MDVLKASCFMVVSIFVISGVMCAPVGAQTPDQIEEEAHRLISVFNDYLANFRCSQDTQKRAQEFRMASDFHRSVAPELDGARQYRNATLYREIANLADQYVMKAKQCP